MLFFRDYGLYDHAMLRFSPANKLSDNFYVRQDGTRAYYFSKGKLKSSFHLCPFHKFTSSLFVPLLFLKKIYICFCMCLFYNKLLATEGRGGTIEIGAYWGGGFIREGDVLDKDAL